MFTNYRTHLPNRNYSNLDYHNMFFVQFRNRLPKFRLLNPNFTNKLIKIVSQIFP